MITKITQYTHSTITLSLVVLVLAFAILPDLFSASRLAAQSLNQPQETEEATSDRVVDTTTNEFWYINTAIAEIAFEGLQLIDTNDISGVYQPYVGRPFSNDLLTELQRRLYALDYFDEIVVVAEDASDGAQESVRLVFRVVENPVVENISFEGNERIADNLLRDETVLKNEDILTNVKIRSDLNALNQFYIGRGFPLVKITERIEDGSSALRKNIIFEIVEGNQSLVREIVFEGNTNVGSGALLGAMKTKTQSLFERGELSEAVLEQDRIGIEEYYRERGYIDAQVLNIVRESELDEEGSRLFYSFIITVEEGPQYKFGEISFEGNRIYSTEELEAEIRIRSGEIFNIRRLESDFQRVANLYYDNGYIFNSIQRREMRDTENNIVSYVIEIIERDRAHIESIILRGNTKTKDHVILRELPFETGEVFNATKIREGILNLYNLQYFGQVLPETPQGSTEGLMDLVINVEEGQTADIRFGLAFGGGGEFPISLQLGWQDRNFLGEGFTFGADLEVSFSTQQVSLTFVEPWLADEPWSLRTDLTFSRASITGIPQDILQPIFPDNASDPLPDPFTGAYLFSRTTTYNGVTYNAGDPFPGAPTAAQVSSFNLVTDYDYAGGVSAAIPEEYLMNYVLWGVGLGVSTGYRFATSIGRIRVGGGLATNIEFIEYDRTIYRPLDQQLRDGWNRLSLVNKLIVRLALDDRDLFYNPSSGYYVGQVLTFTGGLLFGDRHYIRSDTKGELYFTLFDVPVSEEWNFKWVLGFQTLFSAIFPHFYVPPRYSSQPQPIAATQELLYIDGVFFGRGWPLQRNGEALWDSIVELKMPIVERVIWLDLFFESAALWNDLEDVVSTNLLETMRFTFGGGVRFTIPQFPIRLYLAKRFRIVNGAVEWQTSPLFNGENTPGGGIDLVFSIGTDLF